MTDQIQNTIDELGKAFDQFKAVNNQRLSALEAGVKDPILEEKQAKIEADIQKLQQEVDEHNIKLTAAQMHGQGLHDAEYTDAFSAHMKKGDVQAALNKGADNEGGYLAPVEWDRTITNRLITLSPMRQVCRVQSVSGTGFKKLFNMGSAGTGWVGEKDDRPETSTGTFKELTYAFGEIYANPAATQQMLDDAEINLEAWLADEVQTAFAIEEGKAFISGDGTNKPTGLLTYADGGTNASKHPFGAIKTVKSGAASAVTADAMIDLIHSLKKAYRMGAQFMTNNLTVAELRKLKDGQGNYLWQPSIQAGRPATFAGYGIVENEDMPDIAADALSIAFGNFNETYLILDRAGIRILRDPYTKKPYILFYTTKRVGGGLLNPEPMRFLKIGA